MGTRASRFSSILALFLAVLVAPAFDRGLEASPAARRAASAASPVFVANAGQFPPGVRYSLFGARYGVFFMPGEARFALPDGANQSFPLSLRFVGASRAARIVGARRLPGAVNMMVGDAAHWHTNLPPYAEVVYRGAWPGIDAAFAVTGGTLKYEYRIAPGANARDVRLRYDGATNVSATSDGGLDIRTPAGVLHDAAPQSYQEIAGRRVTVATKFVVRPSGDIGFATANYDRRATLVIDPGFVFSTYVGGQYEEQAAGVALDSASNVYIAGYTNSPDFPTTGAPSTLYQRYFVTKLDPTGSRLVYSTLLPISAPSGTDLGQAVAVDSVGNVYLTGATNGDASPTASFGPIGNAGAAFVAKLDASGATLLYNVTLGGSSLSEPAALALDGAGAVYVTGRTSASDFPTTAGAFDRTFAGVSTLCCPPYDTFVFKLDSAGTLVYSTFLGGGVPASGQTEGRAIALDTAGNAYVTGVTTSPSFPTTAGAYSRAIPGRVVFVTKLNPQASALVYSTVVPGGGLNFARGLAVDAAGQAYVVGSTYGSSSGSTLPTTANAVQRSAPSATDYGGFLLKFNSTGTALLYGTYLGGTAYSRMEGIAVDQQQHAYLTGVGSIGFPTTADAMTAVAPPGNSAGVMATVDTVAGNLLFGSYLPATSPTAIQVDRNGDIYVSGTAGSGMQTTANAYQRTVSASTNAPLDAFVMKISANSQPSVTITSPVNNAVFSAGATVTLSAAVGGTVTRLDYYANGTFVGSRTVPPFTLVATNVPAGTYTLTAVVTDNRGVTAPSSPVTITVQTATAPSLPSPWQQADIGPVGLAGSISFSSATGVATVKGAGAGIGGTADAFHFVYEPLTGNGQLVARVTGIQNTDANARAGVMIRDGLGAGAAFVMADVRPNGGYDALQRSAAGTAATVSVSGSIAPQPVWLKLARSGSTVTASASLDGTNWVVLSSTSVNMGSTVYVGLAVTSRNTGFLNTSTFDNVR